MGRMCEGKARYRNPSTAQKVMNKIKAKQGENLRMYKCPICGFYHLTSSNYKKGNYGKGKRDSSN